MILAALLLITGLTLSGVAIYYSVIGLAAIFSAAVIPIYIMGSSLEIAKLVCASWLKANWDKVPSTMKWYMSIAVVVLMLITSMGIFGFLSKAHNDQNLVSGDVQSKLAIYEEKIKTARENIEADRKQLKQMDEAVDQVMGRSSSEEGATKANNIRRAQQRERGALARDIETQQKFIATLNDEAAPIRAENRKVEAEVGPIKYIAKFIYGENGASENMLEKAVTWVIILIVIVFDPLAVIMLLAAQMTYAWHKRGHDPLAEETPTDKYDDIVADSSGLTVDEMIEQEEEKVNDVVEHVTDSEPESALPAYLTQPFAHFKDLKPMPAPHVEPEPKLETTPFDVVDNAPNWTLINAEKLQSELNEANSNVYELANYVQNLQQDYAAVSDLHQKSITREADLIEELANLKEQLQLIKDDQAAMAIIPPEDIHGVTIRPWTEQEISALDAYNDERLVTKYDKIQQEEPVVQESEPILEVQEEYTPVEVTKHTQAEDTVSLEEELEQPEIQTLGIDVQDRPGDYITDPVVKLFNKREPQTGFGNNFPEHPERGDLFLRTDLRPSRLFKWNDKKWIEVNKNTTTAYTYNDAYIQFLAEQVLTGVYTWDDLTEAEVDQVQTLIGGRRG